MRRATGTRRTSARRSATTRLAAHVHAYLHRKEGDQSNAEYWYRRARAAPSALTLDAEWEELVRRFLAQG